MSRTVKKKPKETEKHYCGDCGRGRPYYEFNNMDKEGKPICVICPLHEYKMVRSEKACNRWIEKTR